MRILRDELLDVASRKLSLKSRGPACADDREESLRAIFVDQVINFDDHLFPRRALKKVATRDSTRRKWSASRGQVIQTRLGFTRAAGTTLRRDHGSQFIANPFSRR